MLIYFSLIIPLITGFILLFFYKHKTVWWEPTISIGVTLLFIVCFKSCVELSQTNDTEYWGSIINRSEYYEDWDEEVPCRHPIYCTETYECGDGKTSRTCTRQYVCGYEHFYDVDYHPPQWYIKNNLGEQWSVSQNFYENLIKKWSARPAFVELNRDYHSKDGNEYYITWNNKEETAELTTSKHSYENRVQASHNVINYPEVDDSTKKWYGLYDYPEISGWYQRTVIGSGGVNFISGLKKMDYLNGYLGKSKRMRAYLLIFKNRTQRTAELQEAYWKGGNKNEFIICVGVDNKDKISWTHIFSWTKAEEPKIKIRDYILLDKEQKDVLDVSKLCEFCHKTLMQDYQHRSFKEFSYLTVEPPFWAVITTYIVVLIINIGASIWIVMNEFDEKKS